MRTSFARRSQTFTATLGITDDYLREYRDKVTGDRINPAMVTVTIDPDHGNVLVVMTGRRIRRVAGDPRGLGTVTMEYPDWIDALRESVDVPSLVADAVWETASWANLEPERWAAREYTGNV